MKVHGKALRVSAAAAVALLSLAACGDDDDDETGSGSGTEVTEDTEAEVGETIEVTGIDYGYEGLDGTIEAGSKLSFTNGSDKEAHELVAFLIPEGEERSMEELLALPEEELGAVFGGEPEPVTVILAAPGETDQPGAVVGDGSVTEPGRYGVACFLPVGGDPAVVLDPNAEGPPDTGDAPPHFTQGMFAEFTVE
jgi:hypothetical protein